jgi:hypothetical protein
MRCAVSSHADTSWAWSCSVLQGVSYIHLQGFVAKFAAALAVYPDNLGLVTRLDMSLQLLVLCCAPLQSNLVYTCYSCSKHPAVQKAPLDLYCCLAPCGCVKPGGVHQA